MVGKSGSGKTTLQQNSWIDVPQSVTTRKQRVDETGYAHITIKEYMKMLNEEEIILPNFIYGNWYGVLRKTVERKVTCIVLDAVGLRQMQELYGFDNVTGIMIESPRHVLSSRMRERGDDKEKIIERITKDEYKFMNIYDLCDYKITNDEDINESIFNLRSIIKEVLLEKEKKRK